MKKRLIRIPKWFILLFAILVISLISYNQYTIEQYINRNKSRYSFLDDRSRQSYIPFTIYDIWGIISIKKKQTELLFCEALFKQYGYPDSWSPNKDSYLISIYFTSKDKKELMKPGKTK